MTFLRKKTAASIPVTPIPEGGLDVWLKKQDKTVREWVASAGYTAATGATLLVPGKNGKLARVLIGIGKDDSLYTYSALPGSLPKHKDGYYLDKKLTAEKANDAALGWALGSYAFTRYKKGRTFATLVWPEAADKASVTATIEATYLVRDLVNTPPNDLGPAELQAAAKKIAGKSPFKVIVGNDLLKKNYPAIHAVGKGSPRAPRLLDFSWGSPKNPKLTLVGKGVCFDTGGLNIKPGGGIAGMHVQKKDMGGAAHVLGLAHMIMAAKLPVRLRVLIPAVENSIDGNCFRPGDILQTRKGLTVEVGNTDAEGRLVLADALAEASAEKPELIVSFATLTGAARVALGPDLPATFSTDDKLGAELIRLSHEVRDPLWLLPLWKPYTDMMSSKIADLNNDGGGFAGSILGALFMQKFVGDTPWIYLDTWAWTIGNRPGRPDGGDALGMRACYALIEKKFGKKRR